MRSPLLPEINRLTGKVVDAAFHVHSAVGPGLLESVYEVCLAAEFRHMGLAFSRQLQVPIEYRDVQLESGLRLDFLVEGTVVVELKSLETVLPVHEAQLLSYMRLCRKPVGLLINFNVPTIREGVRRIINPEHARICSRLSLG